MTSTGSRKPAEPFYAADDDPSVARVLRRARVDERAEALGRRLRGLRTSAGLDPTELATAAGLDPVAYRRVEAGDAGTLTYLDLLALADALAVPPACLLR